MKRTSKILICALLVAVIGLIASACSENQIRYADIESIDVEERLRSEDFPGFPVETFDISQITLVIKYKDGVDENGATVAGETVNKKAEEYMLKAEDREKLKTAGTKSITLVCYGREITFSLRLYNEASEKYTVTFYDEDGETQLGKTQRVAEGGRAEQPDVPVKDGYNFIGWIDADTGKSAIFDNVRKNLRLIAVYEAKTVSIGYYYIDGNEEVTIKEISVPTGTAGEDYLPEPPVREGFEFVGWQKANDLKFYARYEEVRYRVKFVYRKYADGQYVDGVYNYGGKYDDSFSTVSVGITSADSAINPPDDYLPTDVHSNGLSDANDYRFVYWYVKRDGGILPVDFPVSPESAYETTYYAYYIDINRGSEELVYKKSADSCIISGYNGNGGVVVIPEKTIIEGRTYDVTGIGDGVFKTCAVTEFVVSGKNRYFRTENGALYNSDATVLYAYPSGAQADTFELAETTEEISPYAFYNAKNLTAVNMNDGLLHIKDFAFRECTSLKSVTIPKNVIDVGEGAFRMSETCALESIVFAGTEILSLGDEAFYGLGGLSSIDLPASLSSLGDGVFYGCSGLTRIDASRNSYFTEYNGALYSVDYRTLYAYPAKYGENENPEVVLHENCRTIARGAFYFANVSCITIRSDCELETYSIVCPSLVSVRIDSVAFGFDESSFTQAFAEYAPDTVYVRSGNESFASAAVSGMNIVYYDDWQGFENYYEGYAYAVKGDGIVINAYNGTSSSLFIPVMINGMPVTEIADNAFNGNSFITSAEIPIEVTKIGEQAFMDCKSLVSVTVRAGEGARLEIGARAFYGCSSLAYFNVNDGVTVKDFGEYVFEGSHITEKDEDFIVIAGVLVAYRGSSMSVTVPGSVRYIATDAFKDCGFITEISFETGSALETVDEYAFLNCSGIRSITLPSAIRNVRDYAFYGCDYLYFVKYLVTREMVELGSEVYYQAGGFYGEGVYSEFVDTTQGAIYYHVGTSQTVIGGVAFVEQMSPEISPSDLFIGWYYESEYKTMARFPLSLGEGERLDLYALIKENSYVSDGLVYSRNDDGTYSVSGYVGSDEHVVIGKTYMGAAITGIGENVFGETVVEVTIPNELNPVNSQYVSDIVTIGLDAFVRTEWYKNIAGDFVIYDNLLLAYKGDAKIVVVPDSVSIIADGVFKNNRSIEYVRLPLGIRTVSKELFSGCVSLKEVELGSEVSVIKEKAFADCVALEEINFDETRALTLIAADALDNTAWLKSRAYDCVIVNGILYRYFGKEETLHIPAGVTSIAESAFAGNSDLVTLYLPSSLVTIRESAFENAVSLNTVYIPSGNPSIAYIMKGAFGNCYNLSRIDFSSAKELSEIGDGAFERCSALKSLYIPANLTYLGKNSFAYSGVETVVAANGSRLGKIGDGAFGYCRSLKSVEFEGESALTTIGKSAFYECTALERFYNPVAQIEVFEEYALYNCQNLSKVEIDETALKEIGQKAVYRLGYVSQQYKNMVILGNILVSYDGTEKIVEIPANVTLIYDSAFEGNTNIVEITFAEGSALRKINDRAFFGCSSLTEIYFPETLQSVGYKIADGTVWYKEKLNSEDYIVINNTLVKYNIDYTRQADVPTEVTTIIRGAFDGSSVYDIKIGENVTEIQEGAFDGIIPASWEEAGETVMGWTLTIEGTEPPALGYGTEFGGCVSVYITDEETLAKFRLNDEWNIQNRLMKIIARYKISYVVVPGEAESINEETVHALYNSKEVTPYKTTSKQYVFVGWFKDADYMEALSYPYILTGDSQIYAKCVDYDKGSNPEDYILEKTEDGDGYTIKNYLDTTDKNVVIITRQAERDIYSITGYLGYIQYSGTEYDKYVYNVEEKVFEAYDPYGSYPEGTVTYRRNTVIEEISFANNCTIETLGENCFAGMSNLTKITLPSSIKYISAEAFSGCENLREIVFSDGIEDVVIASGAFRNCTALQSIRIPDGITTLEDGAFAGCDNLKDVYLESEIPIVLYNGALPFEMIPSLRIHIPYGKKAVYSSGWADYYDYLEEEKQTVEE